MLEGLDRCRASIVVLFSIVPLVSRAASGLTNGFLAQVTVYISGFFPSSFLFCLHVFSSSLKVDFQTKLLDDDQFLFTYEEAAVCPWVPIAHSLDAMLGSFIA